MKVSAAPYHALLIKGDPERLAEVALGLRDMGIEVVSGPFVVDTDTQAASIELLPRLSEAGQARTDQWLRETYPGRFR